MNIHAVRATLAEAISMIEGSRIESLILSEASGRTLEQTWTKLADLSDVRKSWEALEQDEIDLYQSIIACVEQQNVDIFQIKKMKAELASRHNRETKVQDLGFRLQDLEGKGKINLDAPC